jgi:hypothetical protein
MKYLILFLLAGSVMAEDFKVDPIQYDIPASKWVPAARWYESKGHCTDPMNLFDVCPSKGALLFQQKVADYKKKVALAATEKASVKSKAVAVKAKPLKKASKHA